MKHIFIGLGAISIALCLVISGCSSTPEQKAKRKADELAPELSHQRYRTDYKDVVQASHSRRPLWIQDLTTYRNTDDSRVFFIGTRENQVRKDIAERGSRAEAFNKVSQAIMSVVDSSFGATVTGSATVDESTGEGGVLDEYVQDSVALVSQAAVAGVRVDDVFWLKRKIKADPRGKKTRYVFDAFTLASLERAHFNRLVMDAMNHIENRNKREKKLTEQSIRDAKQRLQYEISQNPENSVD